MLKHYYAALLTTAVTHAVLACFVYFKGRSRLTNLTYAGYSTAIALWSAAEAFAITATSQNRALWLWQCNHVGVIFIPIFFVHFVISLLPPQERKRSKILVWVSYLGGLFFLLMNISGRLIVQVVPKFRFNYFINPTPIYFVFFSLWVIWAIYGLIRLFRLYLFAPPAKKNQLSYFSISMLVAYLGGAPNFLPTFNIEIPFLMPFGTYAIAIYAFFTAYAIVAYRLMNIEVIIKKTLVFAGVFGVVMSVVAGLTSLIQSYLGQYLKIGQNFSMPLSVVIAILLYDPLRKFLVNVTDQYLFQKKESIKVILNRLAENIITILDIDKVGQTILSTLEKSLRLETGAILLKEENEKSYKVLDSFGWPKKELSFEKDDFFIRFLSDTNKIINLESVEERGTLPTAISGKLEEMRADICIPLFLHNDLIGVLTLGKKKSDEEFTQEEIDYFPTVASQVAVALSNARLYDILKKSQIDFAQQAKMAAIGTLSAGISHEIKNPLNHMRLAIGMLRLNRKLGIYKDQSKEQFENEVFDALEKIDTNITRATEVIDRLSSFAKKPKELKIEPMSLEKAMEEAFRLLDRELEHYGISVKKNYAPNLPLVSADLHAIEDIFLNLLVNARHAIKEKGTIAVSTCAQGNEVALSITDSGCGIPKENLEKIFDPFFTTKDTSRNSDGAVIKGTGLGLFIVRELIKKFDGQITVESEMGKGTTFRISFPVANEEFARGA